VNDCEAWKPKVGCRCPGTPATLVPAALDGAPVRRGDRGTRARGQRKARDSNQAHRLEPSDARHTLWIGDRHDTRARIRRTYDVGGLKARAGTAASAQSEFEPACPAPASLENQWFGSQTRDVAVRYSRELIEAGRVSLPVAQTFRLADVAEAQRVSEAVTYVKSSCCWWTERAPSAIASGRPPTMPGAPFVRSKPGARRDSRRSARPRLTPRKAGAKPRHGSHTLTGASGPLFNRRGQLPLLPRVTRSRCRDS